MPSREAASWEPIDSLFDWAENPKKHSEEELKKLVKIIKRAGWGAVLLARTANRQIIAGHGRKKAAKLLIEEWRGASVNARERWHPEAARVASAKEVPVRWMDVDDATARIMALADNRIPEDSKIDDAALADIFGSMDVVDAELAGYDRDEINDLLAVPEESELHEVDLSDVLDEYWIAIRGPMPEQPDALERVREILGLLPDAVVTVGTTRIDG